MFPGCAALVLVALVSTAGASWAVRAATPSESAREEPERRDEDEPKDGGEPDASDEDEPGDEDFDFGEMPEVVAPPPKAPLPYALTGFLRSDWGFWAERFEHNPFAKARQGLDLKFTYREGFFRLLLAGHADYDFAYLVERDSYDGPTLRTYEWDANTREVEVAFSVGEWEITLGRQIVAWGQGDVFSPIDVTAPRDNREPGLADLDDIRMPVLATRVGWFHGAHRLELMLVHESDFGYRPSPSAPFSPLETLLTEDPMARSLLEGRTLDYRHRQDRFDIEQQQFFLRWVYKGEGLDLGLYAATYLDQQGVFMLDQALMTELVTNPELTDVTVDLDHRRLWMVGHSGAFPAGDVLLKWEIAAEIDKSVNTGEPPLLEVGKAGALLHTMLGVTYTGVSDLVLALEVWKPWLIDAPIRPLYDVDAPFIAIRATYRTLRERLLINAAATLMVHAREPVDTSWLLRAELSYEIMDGLKIGGGFVTFQPSDDHFSPFFGLDRHDRLFVKLRWDFQIL